MSRFFIRFISGGALHFPYRFAVVSVQPSIGELGRAQTPEKAERLRCALEVLERYERGELVEPPYAEEPRLELVAG